MTATTVRSASFKSTDWFHGMGPNLGSFSSIKHIMSGYILGEKAHQSQQFNQDGVRIPTTTIKSSSCYHWYYQTSIKLGFGRGKTSTSHRSEN